MPVPISQGWTVATYVLKQKLKGVKRYPFVLMLEPLFRCNLACAGCGKIQYPAHILKTELSPEECFKAVDECGTPMVSIPGGEPLMHSQIDKIVEGLVARKKYIYLCTNALLLKEKLHLFKPSKYLTFSVHVDGQREHHDFSVCREGGYDLAIDGIKEAVKRGFRVTTNTTLFEGTDAKSVRAFGVEKADVVADEEHSGWALEILRKVNGVPRTARIDAGFVLGFEFKRIRETAKAIGAFLDGPYVVTRNDEAQKHETLPAVVDAIYESAKKGLVINRYKGLGEMNPEQLWDTTMNPETRRLLQVCVEDAVEANEVFSILMGDAVEPRREFIEQNALNVKNLDI